MPVCVNVLNTLKHTSQAKQRFEVKTLRCRLRGCVYTGENSTLYDCRDVASGVLMAICRRDRRDFIYKTPDNHSQAHKHTHALQYR